MTDIPVIEQLEILEAKLDSLLAIAEGKAKREFLTVHETADLLRCSQSAIRDKLRNGKLPFQRLGESDSSPILIKRKDIDGLIN